MAVNWVTALAKHIHRCPGMTQDFRSCNKFIHAICGVEIPARTFEDCAVHDELYFRWSENAMTKYKKNEICSMYDRTSAGQALLGADRPTDTIVPF